MSEASVQQPCERNDCVFHVTPLDRGGLAPINSRFAKLSPKRALERSPPAQSCLCHVTP